MTENDASFGGRPSSVRWATVLASGGGANGMNGELQICSSGYTIAVLANVDPPAAMRLLRFIRYRLPK